MCVCVCVCVRPHACMCVQLEILCNSGNLQGSKQREWPMIIQRNDPPYDVPFSIMGATALFPLSIRLPFVTTSVLSIRPVSPSRLFSLSMLSVSLFCLYPVYCVCPLHLTDSPVVLFVYLSPLWYTLRVSVCLFVYPACLLICLTSVCVSVCLSVCPVFSFIFVPLVFSRRSVGLSLHSLMLTVSLLFVVRFYYFLYFFFRLSCFWCIYRIVS